MRPLGLLAQQVVMTRETPPRAFSEYLQWRSCHLGAWWHSARWISWGSSESHPGMRTSCRLVVLLMSIKGFFLQAESRKHPFPSVTRIRTLFPHLQCFVFAPWKRLAMLIQSQMHQVSTEPLKLGRSCSWCWSYMVDKADKIPWWWATQTLGNMISICNGSMGILQNVNCMARHILEYWLKARLHPGWCSEFLYNMNIWNL